ncbi:TPA: tail fiber protein [Escherichia coli]|uniref:tail fiber protein n=1 Tax=Escherichia coli TaxID=562 RepID=UPI00203B5FDA|nr:tail fiber protein [Escherichia coli]MCM2755155.1 tail fiber protein [Escherichia coli]
MLYNTGTIAINGNTATGTGTNWTAPASQVRAGQTIIVMSNPVQLFQISSVNSATSMTVTPAVSPALSGQKYGILVSDNISVDGLAQAMSQLIKEYDENIGAWETFATTSANQNITVTINGTSLSIPALGKLLQKGSNGALPVNQGGTGATNAADARTNLGLGEGAPAIGVPFFWPSAAMPNTVIDSWSSMVFLKFNGAKFSASDYPVLAKVFPSLVLPEARGDFIRIWDDGRGADGGRELLSWQEATNFSQFAGNIGGGAGHAINFHDGIAGNQPGFSRFNFTSNSAGDGVNFVAVRPRNIAFNFLVRAK